MRKNMILCVIGFVLALVTGGYVFAKAGDVSMGIISIPSPGCAPEVTISDNKDSNGCYTMTIQTKTVQNGTCSGSGITPTTKLVCDGRDGAGGGGSVSENYVPYPESNGTPGETGYDPNRQGFMRVTIVTVDEENTSTTSTVDTPDRCGVDYDATNGPIMKCEAQGEGQTWPTVANHYHTDGTYIFPIAGDPLHMEYEYIRPALSSGTTGYPTDPGFTQKIVTYPNGSVDRQTVAIDDCDKYAKSTDTSDRVTKCTVGAPAGTPGATSPYTPGATYCLENHVSDCDQYTVPVGAVETCATISPSAPEWGTTVSHSESEYVEHLYDDQCTTNCTGTVGYKLTKEVMCDGNVRTNKVYDTCSSATAPSNVTCATGYAYQQCTPVDSRASANSYSGCFPDPLNGKYALRDEIVPVSLAADGDYLYYCKVSDCNVASCWVNGSVGGTPYYNDGNGCWGRVSVQGLQGENGESCFVTNDGTNWNMCCSPTYAGNDCSIITDQDIINKLNGMICQVNYTHKYLHDNNGGDPIANDTKAGAIGERIIMTNTCNSDAENLDSIYGTDGQDGQDGQDGNDYDPCDGLSDTEALSTVSRRTTVYVRHGSTDSSTTTTGIGYYTETNVMCNTSGNKIVKKYDKCDPVSLASGASRTVGATSCSGNQTLLMCTPQEGDLTPYPVCSDAEVSDYPKKKYFAPTVSSGKITKEGYVATAHRLVGTSTDIINPAEKVDYDDCRTVYKVEHSRTDDTNTVTATTQTTKKCKVQNYTYPTNLTSTWVPNATEYCLNTTNNASTSCDGYSDSIVDPISTSEWRYHVPDKNGNIPIGKGWRYKVETGQDASGNDVVVREVDRQPDDCKIAHIKPSITSGDPDEVWKCKVWAPGGSSHPYMTDDFYCIGIANGSCDNYQDAQPVDMCNGSTSATAVKSVVSRTYTHSTGSQGSLTSVYKMCDNSSHSETAPDECHEIIPTPAGQTCTNGVWMQCKRQADEGTASATARGTTYGYCATYPQCVGNENSTTIVKKTERAYTAPTKTGANSYYDTPGKMVTNKIPCNSSASAIVDSSEDDQCEEIPDTGSICPTNKVLKSCKRKGDESSTLRAESTYNLCATGTSVFGAIEDNDPCGGDTTSDAAKKKVKNIEYEYVARNATGNTSKVGYSKKTTTMCNTAGNTTEYIYDTCVSVAAASGCSGTNDKNYKCYNQTQPATASTSAREYNTCNPSESAVALSSAVANKLDSDVTFTTGKYNSEDYILMSAGNVTNKPVVAVDVLTPPSIFEVWKAEQTNDTQCQALFGKNCSSLTTSDMLLDLSAQGNWARTEYEKNPSLTHSDLEAEDFQNSLKPCQSGITLTQNGTDDNGGNKYVMTCTEE